MAVNAYLNFHGNCREAVDFYADAFGATRQPITTYGQADSGMPIPPEAHDWVMHTTLTLAGSLVMLADTPPGMPFTLGNNISLVVTGSDIDTLTTLFNTLAEGGDIIMPLQKTFWSALYGFVTDRFGVHWQISHEPPAQA